MGTPVLRQPPAGAGVPVSAPARRPASRSLALVLGGLTGLLGLVAMVRLAAGAFEGSMSRFAWVVVLAAMAPWVVYVSWRGWHGHPSRRALVLVLAFVALGTATVWLAVLGPVLALACSLAGFVVIWVSDWPVRRPAADHLVGMEELQHQEDPD
ncbi:MAG: hypothetical protein ACJ72G_07150 [Friedmanniella sp.]|jgi:hypothetical protein